MKALSLLLATAAFATGPTAAAVAQPPSAAPTETAALPSTSTILRNVRGAVGYARIPTMGPAFTITERDQDGALEELHFGNRRGELRKGDDLVFNGQQAWQFDGRRGIFVPSPLRQLEKLAWPLWVRSHWWLNPRNGFLVQVERDQSNANEIALALTRSTGIVAATVFINRSTWMPERVVVPYERGPFTERYQDYRAVTGVSFPFAVESTYRNESKRTVASIKPLASLKTFAKPPLPSDHSFDARQPAALETLAGAPFPSGTPGHVYVRAALDDSHRGWWHLDSGSDSMIIDEKVAEQAGMEVIGTHRSMGADGNVREGTWRRGKSFMLGRIRIENPVFRALDLSANNAPPGERRMGTIGYDLFARAVVEYADGGRRVRVCNPVSYRLPRGAVWQRLEHIDSTPAFKGVADGLLGLFQIDTGSAGTVDFTKHFHERNAMLRSRPTRTMNTLGSGGSFTVAVGRLNEFKFAGETYRNLEVSFRTGGISREGSAGTIGRDILNRFTMVFDYPNQRLAFLPRASSGSCN